MEKGVPYDSHLLCNTLSGKAPPAARKAGLRVRVSSQPGVADRDIKAPRDFSIVDENATNSERRQTAQTVLTVYDRDNKLLSRLNHRISLSFDEMRNIFGDEEESLRGSSVSGDSEKKVLQEEKVSTTETAREKISEHERVQQARERFEKKIGISVSEEDFTLLKKEGFSKKIEELIIRILAE
ncbi:MAG: hypothetical protein B6245_05880, partial [Desulfobacteraceae bacterium 4572_88]